MKKKLFYLSYDSLIEDISKSQILPYIKFFSKNYDIDIFSFEKKININKYIKLQNDLKKYNIKSYFEYYLHKKNILFYITIIKTIFSINYRILFNKYNIIHIRSLMPCIFIFPLILFSNSKIIFDIRGFWIDEKVDRQGLSQYSLKYLFFKRIEKIIYKISNSIICLTYNSKEIIIKENNISDNKITVIPTCVNSEYFKNININKNNIKTRIVYLGTTTGAYDFTRIINEFKNLITRKNNVYLSIITKDDNKVLL